MPTAEAYITGTLTYGVWMLLNVFLRGMILTILNIAEKHGGDFVAQPVSWMRAIVTNWPLIGLIGIFVSLLAAGIASRRGGGL
jgi:hypothetical protein